ncbi:glycoside hydrolase family 9 protein [Foetidibacter luteolus]|uniref:glycoside hydrolase family 9 protein n=1 Tax=Foetidibacter luteolus TaxID=2608880 RepID=UPI00129A1ABF|nr:glycoside hydrolase family 9 protein [Foetidibacter luteolus]
MKCTLLFAAITGSLFSIANAQTGTENIRLNQLGFYPSAPKIAIITGRDASRFYVLDVLSSDTAFSGETSAPVKSANSSISTQAADFSVLHKPGNYKIFVPGIGYSYNFKIKNNVLRDAAVSSLKGFYYQRVSMPLEAAYAGKWARPAGHPDTEVLIHPSAATAKKPAGTKISSPGGWYDAGDYNKYIVNSGITMGTLLSAYEDFPAYFDTLHTNIHGSNDQLPDILNEIIYNLRWMLTMQDADDGGVYNKCTNAAFDGMVMPGVTTLPRYVVQKGTAATLDFAAVTAQAARILKKFSTQLPGLADSCLKASQYAWQWALQYPSLAYNQDSINQLYEPKISTGGYGDRRFTDEWFWAACELYISTGAEQYYTVAKKKQAPTLSLPTWSNVYLLGCYSLSRHSAVLTSHTNDIAIIRRQLTTFADGYLQHIAPSAFKTAMGGSSRDFNWGSNSNAANQGIALVNAWLITQNSKYLHAALTNLDYILGRNATGYCFVTGLGSKSTMHPHHRPSIADGIDEPVPGLLAGGPNPGMQDKCSYAFTEPETAYSDTDCSYASNEIAINWNAPLVYLANAMEALQHSLSANAE